MNIQELEQRLAYAKAFTPHKVGYYEGLLKQSKANLTSINPQTTQTTTQHK